MEFESHKVLGKIQGLKLQLSEAVRSAAVGAVVGWQTPAGKAYGVVVGQDGKELLCLSAFSRSLSKDKALTHYEDKAASGKLQQAMPGVLMVLQRVPKNKVFRRGRIEGTELRPYMKAAAHLQLESEEVDVEFEGLNEWLDVINESLQDGTGRHVELAEADEVELTDLPKAQQDVAEDMMIYHDVAKMLRRLNEEFDGAWSDAEAFEDGISADEDDDLEENTRAVLHWVKQKYGAAKARAHRDFIAKVRKDPAAHRRKMRQDRKYHRMHRWHDRLMRATARKGFRRVR